MCTCIELWSYIYIYVYMYIVGLSRYIATKHAENVYQTLVANWTFIIHTPICVVLFGVFYTSTLVISCSFYVSPHQIVPHYDSLRIILQLYCRRKQGSIQWIQITPTQSHFIPLYPHCGWFKTHIVVLYPHFCCEILLNYPSPIGIFSHPSPYYHFWNQLYPLIILHVDV